MVFLQVVKIKNMALTPSNMLPLGTHAPDFNLLDTVSGSNISFENISGENGTVVMFICNHCPYVIHVNSEIVKLANEYKQKGFGFVAISSNDAEKYKEDSPDKMSIVAKVLQYPFPYLYDATQEIAKAYDAACTPDFYVFNSANNLTYRGRLDESSPGNGKELTGKDLRAALNAILNKSGNLENQLPSMGCNIKWLS